MTRPFFTSRSLTICVPFGGFDSLVIIAVSGFRFQVSSVNQRVSFVGGRKTHFRYTYTNLLNVNEKPERLSWLASLPIFATLFFYGLPDSIQQNGLVQFLPQILAYLGIGLWAGHNTHILHRFGLAPGRLWSGIGWGCGVGLILGICNTIMILWVVPALGGDISFLKETPHAQIPTLIMVPWGILFIALMVEINFRGFLLGRLVTMWSGSPDSRTMSTHGSEQPRMTARIAAVIGASSLVFAFDPFMVMTFRHLHWIAVWDGFIWGWMRIRLRNLYAVITAHALEVMIMYLSVKAALT